MKKIMVLIIAMFIAGIVFADTPVKTQEQFTATSPNGVIVYVTVTTLTKADGSAYSKVMATTPDQVNTAIAQTQANLDKLNSLSTSMATAILASKKITQ